MNVGVKTTENDVGFSRRDFIKAKGISGVALGAVLAGLASFSCKSNPETTTGIPVCVKTTTQLYMSSVRPAVLACHVVELLKALRKSSM